MATELTVRHGKSPMLAQRWLAHSSTQQFIGSNSAPNSLRQPIYGQYGACLSDGALLQVGCHGDGGGDA